MSLGDWLNAPADGSWFGDQFADGKEVEFQQPIKAPDGPYLTGRVKYHDHRRGYLVVQLREAVPAQLSSDNEQVLVEYVPELVIRISDEPIMLKRNFKIKPVPTNAESFATTLADNERDKRRRGENLS